MPACLFARVLGALVLSLAAWALTAVPASAHTELEEAVPADGALVDALPMQVTLRFGAEVDATFVQVAVLDDQDRELPSADPTVNGPSVTQPVTVTAAGSYRVSYRVSIDGHPITGTTTFTVAPAAVPAPAAAPPSAPPSAPTTPSVPSSTATPAPADTPVAVAADPHSGLSGSRDTTSVLVYAWLLTALGAVAGGTYVTVRRRARRSPAEPAGPADTPA